MVIVSFGVVLLLVVVAAVVVGMLGDTPISFIVLASRAIVSTKRFSTFLYSYYYIIIILVS